MVLAEVLAGSAAGTHALWDYNRENFLYDREMRMETELKILEWRCEQSELWRDDIRDLIGLTEKKMDSYLLVSTLQLGMCLVFVTEGRLEPRTPPWLIHFYMLTLSAAFMYLLMSVWLAVHASIVAQCSAVRLLTQFVRLPIPSWGDLHNMRTFASSYEKLDTKHMMRVPFTRNRPPDLAHAGSSSTLASGTPGPATATAAAASSSSSKSAAQQPDDQPDAPRPCDPWNLEHHGEDRHLYELEHMPASKRRHVNLARRASKQFQSYDAFARVSMAFGSNQLLHAMCYYTLGYICLQDGAPWPAFCLLVLFGGVAVSLVQLDFDMTAKEQALAKFLVLSGPMCVGAATWAWAISAKHAEPIILILLPLGYASHGLWLFFALVACGLELQASGTILPQKFRAVLYMDVFGLLKAKGKTSKQKSGSQAAEQSGMSFDRAPYSSGGGQANEDRKKALRQMKRDLRADARLFENENLHRIMENPDRERASELSRRARQAMEQDAESSPAMSRYNSLRQSADGDELVRLHGHTDYGGEVPYLYNPRSGESRAFSGHQNDDEEESVSGGVGLSARSSASGRGIRTMTAFEEGIDQYCSESQAMRQAKKRARPRLPDEAVRRATSGNFIEAARVAVTPVVKALLPEHEEDEEGDADMENFAEYAKLRHAESYDLENPNPSGEMPGSAAKFDTLSYTPHRHPDDGLEGHMNIVSGHGSVDPGRLPAKIFRLATMLMVLLWALGLFLPFSVFREFMTRPLMVEVEEGGEEAIVGTNPDGLPELIRIAKDVPWLPSGHLIQATWPKNFLPRSLTCDPSGTKLVVADDLGVYFGHLMQMGMIPMEQRQSLRRLVPALAAFSVQFKRVPPCMALEGQAIQDISVACETERSEDCRVVVLHQEGRHLAECPLSPEGRKLQVAAMSVTEPNQPNEWQISESWLNRHSAKQQQQHSSPPPLEYVEAIAANSNCVDRGVGAVSAFRAKRMGCVVAGTSQGRIVQLRGAADPGNNLVPERTIQKHSRAVTRGSLHILPNGYVLVLRHEQGTIQAFDENSGKSAGEWRLPKDRFWLCIAGGGGNLFVLGQNTPDSANRTRLELHQFPVPDRLKTPAVENSEPSQDVDELMDEPSLTDGDLFDDLLE